MSVMMPTFSPRIDRTLFNRYLHSYRRWATNQRQAGAPVTCWCLYLWLAGNRRDQNAAILRTIRKPRQRPEGTTSNEWQGWRQHKRNGGGLSFSEYLARREKMAAKGQGARNDLPNARRKRNKAPEPERTNEALEAIETAVDEPAKPTRKLWRDKPPFASKQPNVSRDDGLRMEPASIVAKINRILDAHGIAPKVKPC